MSDLNANEMINLVKDEYIFDIPKENIDYTIEKDHLSAQTEMMKRHDAMMDVVAARKTGRILYDRIVGLEENEVGLCFVLYHMDYIKIIIPASDVITYNPKKGAFAEASEKDSLKYNANLRLGAILSYLVLGENDEGQFAVASHAAASERLRKENIYKYKVNGNDAEYHIKKGSVVEARVMIVRPTFILVDIFGVEVPIIAKELSYARIADASEVYSNGDIIYVRITDIQRQKYAEASKPCLKKADGTPMAYTSYWSVIQASAKRVKDEFYYEKLTSKYKIKGVYLGTITVMDRNGVFVRLDNETDCLCKYPRDGVTTLSRYQKVSVKILGIDPENGRVWGDIVKAFEAKVQRWD